MTAATRELDPRALRETMARFATGVTVVMAAHDGECQGMTANSFTSVSLTPPLVLVCLTSGSRTAEVVHRAGRFGVSVLSARQAACANWFARRGEDRFEGRDPDWGSGGVPLIPGALARLCCEVEQELHAGDHDVVLGHVVAADARDGDPLLFFGGHYGDLARRDGEAAFWYF